MDSATGQRIKLYGWRRRALLPTASGHLQELRTGHPWQWPRSWGTHTTPQSKKNTAQAVIAWQCEIALTILEQPASTHACHGFHRTSARCMTPCHCRQPRHRPQVPHIHDKQVEQSNSLDARDILCSLAVTKPTFASLSQLVALWTSCSSAFFCARVRSAGSCCP